MQKNNQCAAMLQEIEEEYLVTSHLTGKYYLSEKVKTAMLEVTRHHFVPPEMTRSAYLNSPLPIGHGQTISQPYIVALMTDLLSMSEEQNILEIGTGCGYQSAILSLLAKKVFSIEIIPELARQAKERLTRLGYDNITVKEGDGYYGWPEFSPFDKIIVTAATPEVPTELIKQLKAGGIMVLPIGHPHAHQELAVISKKKDGTFTMQNVLAVAFVPLTRKQVMTETT